MGLKPVMSITLDPAALPEIDIISLAQTGQIVRAERRTEENGIPCFISRKDWDLLKEEYNSSSSHENETLLAALEKTTSLFLQEAAKTYSSLKKQHAKTTLPSTFQIESDLFHDRKTVFLFLVKDMTHPVCCAVISTSPTLLPPSLHTQL